MKLWLRLLYARFRLKKFYSKYRIVWEDPAFPEQAMHVTIPDPRWMAVALAGGYLPPVESYFEDAETPHPNAKPIGPMTEEQAINYLIKKDLPPRVWRDYRGNRKILQVVTVGEVSSNRVNRDHWRLSQ